MMKPEYSWRALLAMASVATGIYTTDVRAAEVKSETPSQTPSEVLMAPVPTPVNSALANAWRVQGHVFVSPRNRLSAPNTREAQKTWEVLTTSASIERGASPDVTPGMPGGASTLGANPMNVPRERGQSIQPSFYASSIYRGLGEIFQYTNDGAPDDDRSCGQAAIATILTHYKIKPRDTGYSVINEVYRRYPPDIAWGILGTSYQQMERALRGYGVPFNWYSGEAGLKNALNLYKPCIVMLDVGTMPGEGWGWGGHWVVAYGYDNSNIYFTNWNPNSSGQADGGKCTWDNFRKGWNGQLSVANGTRGMFICPNG